MELIAILEKAIWDEYNSYKNVYNYIIKWHKSDDYHWENFEIVFKEGKTIDLNATLHSMPGEIVLKMAIELGISTPDFIPAIPTFKNEIKSNYKTAYDTFMKSFKIAEDDPSTAIGLCNSTLESIIKQILKDPRIDVQLTGKETLYKLSQIVLKKLKLLDANLPLEIKTIGSSILSINQSIEKLRSEKTNFHGKTTDDQLIEESTYAYFIINSITTIGLFLNSYYQNLFPKEEPRRNNHDDLPF